MEVYGMPSTAPLPIEGAEMRAETARVTRDGHTITARYTGGRLADVSIDGKLVDAVQVCEYDWQRGEIVPGTVDVRGSLREWARESGDDYIRELPYL